MAVPSIWSDNGRNFAGANNESKKSLKEMDHLKINNYFQGNGTDWVLWHKNPPRASHMGCVWERQIRTARRILEGLLKTHGQSLNDQALRMVSWHRVVSFLLCGIIFYEVIIDHTTLFHDIITEIKPLFEFCSFCPINDFCFKEAFNC